VKDKTESTAIGIVVTRPVRIVPVNERTLSGAKAIVGCKASVGVKDKTD